MCTNCIGNDSEELKVSYLKRVIMDQKRQMTKASNKTPYMETIERAQRVINDIRCKDDDRAT